MYGKEYDDPFPLDVTFNKNSVESRLNDQNYMQTFDTLKDYADDCSQSRYRGGMHFEFSLEPGAWMCTEAKDFIKKAVAYNNFLWTGNEIFLEEFGGLSNFGYEGKRDYEWY